jgi:hypothetical protein
VCRRAVGDPRERPGVHRVLRAAGRGINGVFESFGLPLHREPFDVEDERTFECDMIGYSGLHYLRRLAAHLALGRVLPPPGDDGAASDPVLSDYYKIFDASFARAEAADMPFQHLIVHGDAEGYYLPVEFDDVIIPDASLEIAGGMLGSSHALLRECKELALALELPESLSFEDESVDWMPSRARAKARRSGSSMASSPTPASR